MKLEDIKFDEDVINLGFFSIGALEDRVWLWGNVADEQYERTILVTRELGNGHCRFDQLIKVNLNKIKE